MTSLFDEFLGEQLERVHVTSEGLGDYKSVTFNFANGRSLTFSVELHSRKDAIYPAIRATTGRWELVPAEKVAELKHKPGCASYNNPPAGFASSVTDCDCGVEHLQKPYETDIRTANCFHAAHRTCRYCQRIKSRIDNLLSASLDEVDTCPISGEENCEDCQVNSDCDHAWEKEKLLKAIFGDVDIEEPVPPPVEEHSEADVSKGFKTYWR